MNRRRIWVRLGIVIGVAMVLPVQLASLAQEPAKESVRPASRSHRCMGKGRGRVWLDLGRPVGTAGLAVR